MMPVLFHYNNSPVANHSSLRWKIAVPISKRTRLIFGQPATEVIDTANNKTVHDRTLPGATLTTATPTFTLNAGAFKKITFTLSLDDTVKLNQVVEGFIKFKAADDRQSISVPYMGYYGSTNDKAVFDKPANEEGSIFKGGYLVDNNHNPLGITDPTSLSELVNNPTNGFTWQTNLGPKFRTTKSLFHQMAMAFLTPSPSMSSPSKILNK